VISLSLSLSLSFSKRERERDRQKETFPSFQYKFAQAEINKVRAFILLAEPNHIKTHQNVIFRTSLAMTQILLCLYLFFTKQA
jgi:hypothetical protein